MIIIAPKKDIRMAINLFSLIFSFKNKIAHIAPKIGAKKLIAVAFASEIFEIEKNHIYIAANAITDLRVCNLKDFVLRLENPSFTIHGKMNITANRDLKKIIWVR